MAILRGDAPIRAIGSHARPSRTFPLGRVCEHPACTTALSVYNQSASCSVHEEVRVYIHRGQRRPNKPSTTLRRIR
jgi:hypothetical protein